MACRFTTPADATDATTPAEEAETAQDAFLRLARRVDESEGAVGPFPGWLESEPVAVSDVMEHSYLIQFYAMSGDLPSLQQLLAFFNDRCDDRLVQCLPATMVQLLDMIAEGKLPVLVHPTTTNAPLVLPIQQAAQTLRGRCRQPHHPATGPSATAASPLQTPAASLGPQATLDMLQATSTAHDPVYTSELLMRLHEVLLHPQLRTELTDPQRIVGTLWAVLGAAQPADHLAVMEALMVINDVLGPYTTPPSETIVPTYLPFKQALLNHQLDIALISLAETVAETTLRVLQHKQRPHDIDMTVEIAQFALRALQTCTLLLPYLTVNSRTHIQHMIAHLEKGGPWGESLSPMPKAPSACASCQTPFRFGRPTCECCQLCARSMRTCACDATDPRFVRRLLQLLRFRVYALSGGACSNCGQHASSLLQCSRCRLVAYCNLTCQRLHWPLHKRSCHKQETLLNA